MRQASRQNRYRLKNMVKKRKAQAAFEYLTTYGWAILTALIVTGALAYFGFLNPSNLLPSKCDFGKQLECIEYKIMHNGSVGMWLRNNFGKDIKITGVQGIETGPLLNLNTPFNITSGASKELTMTLDTAYRRPAGEKQEIALIIVFQRAGVSNPISHNISGSMYVTVQ